MGISDRTQQPETEAPEIRAPEIRVREIQSPARARFVRSTESRWTPQDSARLYGLGDWGQGYFDVDELGHLTVQPSKDGRRSIDLYQVVQGLAERGISAPVLIRFSDVLAHQLTELRATFDRAMAESDYQGGYCFVYPVKVNQQRHICEEIRDIGAGLGFGFEVGSKPELLAVLALTEGYPEMPIVCNGFKDDEFTETVILATKLGRNIIPVVEKFSELEPIVRHAVHYDVRPKIGLRVKLSTRGVGRWEDSAGARSKFGLFVTETLRAVDFLREQGMLDCLRLLHCHIGSQVYDIRHVKNSVTELAHVYTELKRLGAPLGLLDIGGGLGVDYDGSRTASESSINYSLDEYAADVVWRVQSVCDDAGVEHPQIITESGRAMVAYSSVLICDVVGKSSFAEKPDMEWIRKVMEEEEEDEVPQPLHDLIETYEHLEEMSMLEVYHDALQARDEAMSLFTLGYMSLPIRAASEQLFWCIGRALLDRARTASRRGVRLPEELQDLPETLSDIYFCNFSLFQSVPDSWAIGQLFPIVPIHRLDEEPLCRGIIADITCDSDGTIDRFVGESGGKRTLELHDLRAAADGKGHEPYYLGVFLVGAYQEILGDLHNLLGDTHAVHVRLDDTGQWCIEEVVEGDKVREVLSYVRFDHTEMRRTMRRDIERAVRSSRLTVREGKSLLQFYERGLDGYTYLEE